MPPAVFQERVARGEQGLADGLPLKFTHRSDAKLVSQLQEGSLPPACQASQKTEACSLPQHEVSILAAALPHFVNLEELVIGSPAKGFNFGHSILELARSLERLRPEKPVTSLHRLRQHRRCGGRIFGCSSSGMQEIESVLSPQVLRDRRCRDSPLVASSLAAHRVVFSLRPHVSHLADRLPHKWGHRDAATYHDSYIAPVPN